MSIAKTSARERPGRPSQMTVIHIDGDHVTAEGLFDELLTLEREEVAGTLDRA